MSRIKYLIALLLTPAFVPPSVQGQVTPLTVQEWSNRQAEIKRAEMDSRLREQRSKLGADQAPRVARSCDEDLSMFAVYGMGSRLRADFAYRGAVVTLGPGDRTDIGGWFVEELTPTRALMVQRKGKNMVGSCPVYLSARNRDASPGAVVAAAPADAAAVQVPPIKPLAPR